MSVFLRSGVVVTTKTHEQQKDVLKISCRYSIPLFLLTTGWLATFVLEAWRKDGDFYPGNTLKNLLAALFQAMKATLVLSMLRISSTNHSVIS